MKTKEKIENAVTAVGIGGFLYMAVAHPYVLAGSLLMGEAAKHSLKFVGTNEETAGIYGSATAGLGVGALLKIKVIQALEGRWATTVARKFTSAWGNIKGVFGKPISTAFKPLANEKGYVSTNRLTKTRAVRGEGERVKLTQTGRLDYSVDFVRDLESFRPGVRFHKGSLKDDLHIVQFHKKTSLGDGRSAKWWTPVDEVHKFRTLDDVVNRLGLPPDWGSRKMASLAKIPKGTDVTFYIGKASEKVSLRSGKVYKGEGIQIRFKDFDPKWVRETREMPYVNPEYR